MHPKLKLAAVLLLVIISAVLISADVSVINALNRQYASLSDIARKYNLGLRRTVDRIDLGRQGAQLSFFPDKRYAYYNNVKFTLDFPAFVKGGRGYVSVSDMRSLVDPLLNTRNLYKQKIQTIILDPGHGGKDCGALGKITQEKLINLRLAKRLAELLTRMGYNVVLTRNGDSTLTLEQRTGIASQRKADLFLSLHVNSAADRSISGIETFCLTPSGAPSSNGGTPDYRRLSGNRFDSNNIMLAYCMQRNLLVKTGAEDRGVKRARFQVLRDVNCPAVLIEIGFISNRAEEQKMAGSAYIDTVARAIADGVGNYQRALR